MFYSIKTSLIYHSLHQIARLGRRRSIIICSEPRMAYNNSADDDDDDDSNNVDDGWSWCTLKHTL